MPKTMMYSDSIGTIVKKNELVMRVITITDEITGWLPSKGSSYVTVAGKLSLLLSYVPVEFDRIEIPLESGAVIPVQNSSPDGKPEIKVKVCEYEITENREHGKMGRLVIGIIADDKVVVDKMEIDDGSTQHELNVKSKTYAVNISHPTENKVKMKLKYSVKDERKVEVPVEMKYGFNITGGIKHEQEEKKEPNR